MKLAEALQERADLNRKIEELKIRLEQNVLMQEDETPEEDPQELLAELEQAVTRLQELIVIINQTNAATFVEGRSLMALIAEKDCLSVKLAAYKNIIQTASNKVARASHSEIKIVSAVNVKALQKEADRLARQIRLLDNMLQQCNWTTDI